MKKTKTKMKKKWKRKMKRKRSDTLPQRMFFFLCFFFFLFFLLLTNQQKKIRNKIWKHLMEIMADADKDSTLQQYEVAFHALWIKHRASIRTAFWAALPIVQFCISTFIAKYASV